MSRARDASFGEFLHQLRQRKGWSLREAATRVGIAHSRIDECEKMVDARTGKHFVPSYVTVVKFAKAYGYPPDDLLRRAGYEPGIELEQPEWRLVEIYRKLPADLRGKLLETAEQYKAESQESGDSRT